jgi:putative ATP-binding cassette transporter
MQAAQAFQRLTSALSWPIDNLGEIARCRASAERVASLYADLLDLEEHAETPSRHRVALRTGNEDCLVLRDLTLSSPDGQVLVERLDEVFLRGERVLISGDAGAATSLFKAVAGLWPWGEGAILLPAGEDIMFLPQRPFLPDGSLQDALSYPQPAARFAITAQQRALRCAGLDWLVPRLTEQDRWDAVLPLRAQQRLGVARLLLQRPAWAFIEEATDAFDPGAEASITEVLNRELAGSTLLTVSFHPAMERHYSRHLVLRRPQRTSTPGPAEDCAPCASPEV